MQISRLKIKVIPNSPKTRISENTKRPDIDMVIELHASAENGKANIELINFLRLYLGKDVKIISGFKSRIKEIVVINP